MKLLSVVWYVYQYMQPLTPPRRALVVTVLVLTLALLAAAACAESEEAMEAPTPAVLVGGDAPRPTDAGAGATTAPGPQATEAGTFAPTLVSLDWLSGDVAVPGLEGGVASPVPDQGLQEAVAAGLAGFGGNAAVVVHNLADGRYAATNETAAWYAASTFKAALLLEAYRQRDAGELDFAEAIELKAEYTQYDLETLEYLGLKTGDLVSVADAVRGMIVVSDTSLAALVQEKVTGNKTDETLRAIGATTMTVNDSGLPTTALDLAQLMIAVGSGYDVTPQSRDEMLSLMAQEWFTQGIMAGVPGGTTLAHKSGNLGNATHDAAIVWGPAGPYVIVVMTDGSGGWPPIASVSAAVWEYFAGSS
jgi:beta-lactamase class A